MTKNNDAYRSAIKEKPLRRAGQSIEEEIENIFDSKLLGYVLAVGMSSGFIIFIWLLLPFTYTIFSAVIMTIFALTIAMISLKKAWNLREELYSYREGLRGERFMGDHLDTLKEKGCKVFHDFVVRDQDLDGNVHARNVDHIVLNSKGIYAIETKALRKSKIQKEELSYDGMKIIYKDGRKLKYQPLDQAKRGARDVKEFLAEEIGKEYTVQPVVVFPNWFIKPSTYAGNKNKHDVWVCNHKYLEGLINEGPDILNSQEISVISKKLSKYIRNYESKI